MKEMGDGLTDPVGRPGNDRALVFQQQDCLRRDILRSGFAFEKHAQSERGFKSDEVKINPVTFPHFGVYSRPLP
jgi:hypothetical protein